MGISKQDSHRWQRIASLTEEEFEGHVQGIRQANREITTASVLAIGRSTSGVARKEASIGVDQVCDDQWQALRDSGTRFGTIYVDPPWIDNHHAPRMTVNQLCALPVETIAADEAHLHLWAGDSHLFDAKKVIDAWGFNYAGCFVWIKPAANVGNHWGVAHEFLLLGVRGSCSFHDCSLKSWAEIEPTQDGRKPNVFRQMIERASPGPRIELFANQAASGWTVMETGIACAVDVG